MRYLVTGGAGFIGSNLVRHIVTTRADAEVVNLDALTYAGNLESLADVEEEPRHRFVHGDISDGDRVADVMAGVDVVLHLAAESHVDRSILSDALFVRTNVLGTHTLLAAALQAGVKRFVQVSTDEVYGELPWRDPDEGDAEHATSDRGPGAPGGTSALDRDPFPRFTEDTPLAPRSPYSATKAAADHLALAYHTTHGMDVVVTRCSNNYGPYQFPEKLIPLLITHVLKDRPLPVYGDGLYVRDWIHVEDHCRAILAAADGGRAGSVYNFGGDAEHTNLYVVRTLLRIMGRPDARIEHVEDRPGHDRRYAMDFGRAEVELGWRPRVAFEKGLKDTVEWYMAHETWWRRVMTGEYRAHHRERYGG
ncbi:MAG: dTDP-glucose 4,6-dehydratase [Gemmatimonadetes bacterium]|nr:dTDP-glucose 4,6-dehydratase [Gemmatimonadota bacterium]